MYESKKLEVQNNCFVLPFLVLTSVLVLGPEVQGLSISAAAERHDDVSRYVGDIKSGANFSPLGWKKIIFSNTDEYRCGDREQCQCQGTEATCYFDKYSTATYIPKLPVSIRKLSYHDAYLTTLTDKSFFQNVTRVESLKLDYNDIRVIDEGVFDLMPNLTEIDLSANERLVDPNTMDFTALRNVLASPTLETVYLWHCKITSLPGDLTNGITTSNVRLLSLRQNDMFGVLNMSAFCPLQSLVGLDIGENRIHTVESDCVSAITYLSLNFNNLKQFIPSCGSDGRSLFPNLQKLNLRHNNIHTVGLEETVCLPNLNYLNLEFNILWKFSSVGASTFRFTNFPLLQSVVLSNVPSLSFLTNTAFENSHVQKISLENNNLDFQYCVHVDTFCTCWNLTELSLNGNDFSSVSDEKFQNLFCNLPLIKIFMNRCGFGDISVTTFSKLSSLEILDLSDNKIAFIANGAFDMMKQLRKLDLSKNKIQTIGEQTFGEQLRNNLLLLRMETNPFVCGCDLLWFQGWLLDQEYDKKDFACSNVPKRVVDASITQQACIVSQEASRAIAGCCALLIVLLLLVMFLFRYRWHVRLLLYEVTRGRGQARRQRLVTNTFKYDVFVSYAAEDLAWVRQQLSPQLEERMRLRLCIHERDFVLGENIVDNIARCVESSKKVLMVFSRHFVRSQWCQFELTYCLRHVMDYDDALLIVCVDDVASRDMTTAMMAVLKTTTFLQWAEDEGDALHAFWGRLGQALEEVVQLEVRM